MVVNENEIEPDAIVEIVEAKVEQALLKYEYIKLKTELMLKKDFPTDESNDLVILKL